MNDSDLVNQTAQWVKGEVIQGRFGLCIGILIAFLFVYYANFEQSFCRGAILPFTILQVVLLGYSGFQMAMRPKHIEKVTIAIQVNLDHAVQMELDKSKKDDKIYKMIKMVWAALFVVALFLFLVSKNDFGKGMSIGFVIFFGFAYVFDSLLHSRLKTYLEGLERF